MRVKLTVQDHAHGGDHITVRETVVNVTNRHELLEAMRRAMGDYPVCHADPA